MRLSTASSPERLTRSEARRAPQPVPSALLHPAPRHALPGFVLLLFAKPQPCQGLPRLVCVWWYLQCTVMKRDVDLELACGRRDELNCPGVS